MIFVGKESGYKLHLSNYVLNTNNKSLIIYGPTGSGKTELFNRLLDQKNFSKDYKNFDQNIFIFNGKELKPLFIGANFEACFYDCPIKKFDISLEKIHLYKKLNFDVYEKFCNSLKYRNCKLMSSYEPSFKKKMIDPLKKNFYQDEWINFYLFTPEEFEKIILNFRKGISKFSIEEKNEILISLLMGCLPRKFCSAPEEWLERMIGLITCFEENWIRNTFLEPNLIDSILKVLHRLARL